MSKHFFALAFAAGLAGIAWVGLGFVGSSWFALAMTALIAVVYLLGAFELRQFRRTTADLSASLERIPQPLAVLGDWLALVPAGLRDAVRLRIEGERVPLPGPALTPYLVGLLVMLGMLGTFLGMVVTFRGAVFALEGSADLQAIRSALAGPIKGLALAFGSSVAGVAASAMLGLMSAISRRERIEVARRLDGRIAGVLQPFSLVHQRQETFRSLQLQANALPGIALQLSALMERIDQRSEQLDARLLERQGTLQRDVVAAYTQLADKVGAALQDNLAAGARAAGDSIRPVVAAAMAQLVEETRRTQEHLGDVARSQVDALSRQFGETARTAAEGWTAAATEQRRSNDASAAGLQQALASFAQAFEQRSAALVADVQGTLAGAQAAQAAAEAKRLQAWTGSLEEMATAQQAQLRAAAEESMRLVAQLQALVRSREEAESRGFAQHRERMAQLVDVWRTELQALRQDEGARGEAAVARLGDLEAAVARHLGTLGAALEAPITRLLQTAAEVPQAAAGVIAQLREQMGHVAERDKLALQERTQLLERLGALVQSLEHAAGGQRAAIDTMVASASAVLEQAGAGWMEAIEAHAGKAADMSAHLTGSAVELASLAESFGQGVQAFQASNDKLGDTLQRIEASLARSTARSDEQLAYYVAQAREVIDLSIASQQGVFENLRQLQARPGDGAGA